MTRLTIKGAVASSAAGSPGRLDAGGAALWASAFVILALVIVQAGRLGGAGEKAYAGDVAELATLRLLTASSGDNEEFLAILNHTDETISIYGIENGRSVELFQVQSLPEMFTQARGAVGGRR